jgi:regulator of replication initiation timing
MIRDLSNQIDESTQEINSTKETLQQITEENNSLRSDIERTNIFSFIATGLGACAINYYCHSQT